MSRPLFEEPTADIERDDASSGPYGVLIGGAANPAKAELARQYFEAADLLLETIKQRGESEDYTLANPALFLYRHSLELMLKAIVGTSVKGHSLAALADEFETFVREKFQQQVPNWLTARLREIAAVDPNSTAFRYAEN